MELLIQQEGLHLQQTAIKMKYLLLIIFSVVLTFLIISILFFKSNNLIVGDQIEFATMDNNFKFTCMPSKGRDYGMMTRVFEEYKLKNKYTSETRIFRVTVKNYLKINLWCSYKSMPEWNHEYLPFWKR